jgi:hypothetical protein
MIYAALGVLLVACGPLELPRAQQAQRCPAPCPATCPDACMPAGYCSEVTRTAAQLGLGPIHRQGTWDITLAGFPPGVATHVSIHAGFDIAERTGTPPGEFVVKLGESYGNETFLLSSRTGPFPLWGTFQGSGATQQDGTARLQLRNWQCDFGSGDPSCVVDPSSTISVTLVSTAPWQEAPLCGG